MSRKIFVEQYIFVKLSLFCCGKIIVLICFEQLRIFAGQKIFKYLFRVCYSKSLILVDITPCVDNVFRFWTWKLNFC